VIIPVGRALVLDCGSVNLAVSLEGAGSTWNQCIWDQHIPSQTPAKGGPNKETVFPGRPGAITISAEELSSAECAMHTVTSGCCFWHHIGDLVDPGTGLLCGAQAFDRK
jgi:hypothetical protein